jgi:hypothetical protein
MDAGATGGRLMASVSRNPKDPGWQARWRDPGGRQRKKNFTRKVDAQRWLDQMQAERHRGQYVDPRAGKVRVSEVAEGWARGLTHLKVSTATRYRGLMCGHILPRFGAWAVADLRHSDVRDWVNDLSASGLSAGTVRQAHRVLSLILSESVKDGRIARNVAAGVQLPRAVRADPRFLDADEVARLIAGAGTNGLSIAVLAFCGLRFGELAVLQCASPPPRRGRERHRGRRSPGVVVAEDEPHSHGPVPTVADSADRGTVPGQGPG